MFKLFVERGINKHVHENIIEFKKYLIYYNKSAHTI